MKRKTTATADHWRGYSLNELRFERALNKLRMEVEKERLRSALNPQMGKSGLSLSDLANNAGRYLNVAVVVYGVVRRVVAFFRRFKRK